MTTGNWGTRAAKWIRGWPKAIRLWLKENGAWFGSLAQWMSALATAVAAVLIYSGYQAATVMMNVNALEKSQVTLKETNEKLVTSNEKLAIQSIDLERKYKDSMHLKTEAERQASLAQDGLSSVREQLAIAEKTLQGLQKKVDQQVDENARLTSMNLATQEVLAETTERLDETARDLQNKITSANNQQLELARLQERTANEKAKLEEVTKRLESERTSYLRASTLRDFVVGANAIEVKLRYYRSAFEQARSVLDSPDWDRRTVKWLEGFKNRSGDGVRKYLTEEASPFHPDELSRFLFAVFPPIDQMGHLVDFDGKSTSVTLQGAVTFEEISKRRLKVICDSLAFKSGLGLIGDYLKPPPSYSLAEASAYRATLQSIVGRHRGSLEKSLLINYGAIVLGGAAAAAEIDRVRDAINGLEDFIVELDAVSAPEGPRRYQ